MSIKLMNLMSKVKQYLLLVAVEVGLLCWGEILANNTNIFTFREFIFLEHCGEIIVIKH